MQVLNAISVVSTEEQNKKLDEVINQERGRLFNFIKKQVGEEVEAEDILQDVFYQLVATYRLMKPVEQVSAWMFRVARNRIVDLFRKKKPVLQEPSDQDQAEASDVRYMDAWLAAFDDGPEGLLTRKIVMEELDEALAELPEEQRNIFVWHELEGRSFKDLSEMLQVPVSTLLSRKRYAVAHLRERLQGIYESFVND